MEITARREEEEEEQAPKKTKINQQQNQPQEVDRISQLPDDILIPILSLLTLEEACITSTVSKRWRNLFPSLPRLDLNTYPAVCSSYDISPRGHAIAMDSWLEKVGNILESRRDPVRICTLVSNYFSPYREDFDNIICFLCNDGIQELSLYNEIDEYFKPYTVPYCLYFCRTLTCLDLYQCILKPPPRFSLLRHLRAIKIQECIVEDGDLQRLISGCRAVERLTLQNCYRLGNIAVDADKLAVIDVTSHMPHRPFTVSVVNAPRLESVTVRFQYDYPGRLYLLLEDPEDSFHIDGSDTDDEGDTGESEGSRLLILLESLGNVQNLSLEFSLNYLKILRTDGVAVPVTLKSLLPKMKRLTLKTQLNSIFILSIVSCLLNSCPNLEALVFADNCVYGGEYDVNEYSYPEASVLHYWDQQMPSDCMRNTLSVVTLYLADGYFRLYWIELVKFLLKNACVLKNLVIHCYNPVKSMLEDYKMGLLQLQPASPDAVVELKTTKFQVFQHSLPTPS